MSKLAISLLLLLGIGKFCWAQTTPTEKVPPEYILAQVPGLPILGPARVSWVFLRPPFLWAQDEAINLNDLRWPQWDVSQVPLALVPAPGRQSYIQIEDEQGTLIEELPLKAPFLADTYKPKSTQIPHQYRIRLVELSGRVSVTSRSFPWNQRKSVFQCQAILNDGQSLPKASEIQSCVESLKAVATAADRQWYVQIKWPRAKSREAKAATNQVERDLRSLLRKKNHVYESETSPNNEFQVTAGITGVEKLSKITFAADAFAKAENVQTSPTREQIQIPLLKANGSDTSQIEITAIAADELSTREKFSPSLIQPPLHVQFVAGDSPKLTQTEFKETRTGFLGLLRTIDVQTFLTLNILTSNRGERAQFLNIPGFDFSTADEIWGFSPWVRFETGAIHLGSGLSFSEISAGFNRGFEFMPPSLRVRGGLSLFQLSGTNPGSSRLGKMSAVQLGLETAHRISDRFIRGRVTGLYQDAFGFEAILEAGQLLWPAQNSGLYASGQFGYQRLATKIENRIRITETFTEDRIFLGLSVGYIGPDRYPTTN